MRDALTNPSAGSVRTADPTSRAEMLRRFVHVYWLRPENAFWMTLRSQALSRFELGSPSIDVSCGDGIFTFLHCGGQFSPDFDVFQSVADLEKVRDHHADMFDAVCDGYAPKMIAAPSCRVDVGADMKRSMLMKAGKLNFYGELVEHDNNQPLPFEDDSFETVYCNSAYWVECIDGFLPELSRIVRPGGRVVLQVKLDAMRGYTLSQYESTLGKRFLDIIGRGRLDCWPSLCDRGTSEKRFAKAGLSIVEATPFVTATHSHIWDIGLRPIAPLLVKMTDALSPETRASIKSEWVDLFCELLEPMCDPDLNLLSNLSEPAEIQYVLSC